MSMKFVSSAGLVAASYFSTWYLEREKAVKENAIKELDDQIRQLYGPLYGHCLVLKSLYASVIGDRSGMAEYLNEAEAKKDAGAIRRWRSFVWNNIRPLEREIHQVLVKNSHLIHDFKYPEEFNDFLNHSARFEFVVERWKNEQGKLETTAEFTSDDFLEDYNSTGEPNYNQLFQHVSSKYEKLQNEREEILLNLSGNARENGIKGLLGIFK